MKLVGYACIAKGLPPIEQQWKEIEEFCESRKYELVERFQDDLTKGEDAGISQAISAYQKDDREGLVVYNCQHSIMTIRKLSDINVSLSPFSRSVNRKSFFSVKGDCNQEDVQIYWKAKYGELQTKLSK